MPASSSQPIPHVSVAGVHVTTLRRKELKSLIQNRLHERVPTRIVTPYSEFLFRSAQDPAFCSLLNEADISLPDGIAMLWGATFLSAPLTARSTLGAWFQSIGQMVWTGASIVLQPSRIAQVIPETIPGSDFVFDLCELAVREKASIFIAGGFGDVPAQSARILTERYPGLLVAGTSNASIGDIESEAAAALVQEIQESGARMLFLALGPQKQEQFMMRYWDSFHVDLAIGLGGTFNYLTGKSHLPPAWVRSLGLEWLFRLITEPTRMPRIYRATIGLIQTLVRYKVRLWTNTRQTGTL